MDEHTLGHCHDAEGVGHHAAQSRTYTYGDGRRVHIEANDCIAFLRSLPSASIDLITTDPAYSGMNNRLKLGHGRIVGRYAEKGTDDGRWFAEFEDSVDNYRVFLAECRRVLKRDTGHIYIMFDSYSLLSLGAVMREFFDVKSIITWDKVNMGMGHYFRRMHEFIIFATNGNQRKLKTRAIPDVWRFKRIHQAKYPTQKPVEIFDTMVFASGEPGFTVCDPFMGSGSAALAAIKGDCHFVGCDVAVKSIEITGQRIEAYLADGHDILQPKSAAPTKRSPGTKGQSPK